MYRIEAVFNNETKTKYVDNPILAERLFDSTIKYEMPNEVYAWIDGEERLIGIAVLEPLDCE